MSRTIAVSPREVAAARLQLVVDAKLGRPTPDVIRKIADAQPESRLESVIDKAG